MTTGHGYTPDVHVRIVQACKLGATRAMCAQAAGIGARTLARWLADGKKNPDGPFGRLRRDMMQADGASGTHALGCIVKAAKEGKWQAAAWLLERKHGYRRDGVKELTTHAIVPGNSDAHALELLAETRRLRIAATSDGSHVAAARLLEMESVMVNARRAEERAESERSLSDADHDSLISTIRDATSTLPREVLDELAKIIAVRRKVAV